MTAPRAQLPPPQPATRRGTAPRARLHPSSFILRPSRPRAFTLLELILAMAVTCMLAVALYGSLRTAMKAKESATAAVEPARAAQIALDLIGRDLESALRPTGILAGAFAGVDGGNDVGDTISYFTVVNGVDNPLDPTANDGIKNVELLVVPGDDGSNWLVRRVTGNLLSDQTPVPVDEVLIRNVTRFNVQYIADDVVYDEWDSTANSDTLPALIHIDVEVHRPTDPSDLVRRFSRSYALALAPPPGSAAATTGGAAQ